MKLSQGAITYETLEKVLSNGTWKKTVVVGVTGGIAVYKALDVISKLKEERL